MKWIKIISCGDPRMWYAGCIGKSYSVRREYKSEYLVLSDDGFTNIIKRADCVIIS